jgi:hypothetical protein
MKIALLSTLTVASLMASTLADQAQKAGLTPIPESQSALLKLIDSK